MSSLSDRLTRAAATSPSLVDHVRRLVADWQLLADLSFADPTMPTLPVEYSCSRSQSTARRKSFMSLAESTCSWRARPSSSLPG